PPARRPAYWRPPHSCMSPIRAVRSHRRNSLRSSAAVRARWRRRVPRRHAPPAHAARLRSAWSYRHSSQVTLLGANRPLRKPFSRVAVFDEVAHHPFDIVTQLVAGDLVLPQFSAEAAVQAEAAAQVHLEALDRVAVTIVDHLALETDVGHLNSSTRVGAAIDVDRDRHVQAGVDV